MGSIIQELRELRSDPEYLNFIAVGEALRILGGGLRYYSEQKAKELQEHLIKKLSGYKCNCSYTLGVKPCRHACMWGKELENLHVNTKKNRIPFHQSDSTRWHDPNNGYWEVAKVFMSDLGAKWCDVKDPASTDLTGLLNFLIFCKRFKVQQNLLKSVRDLRNDLAHTTTCKLSASEKQAAFIAIDNLLNDADVLSCKEVQDCCLGIDEVKNADVSFVQERDLEVLKELTRHQEFAKARDAEARRKKAINMIKLISVNVSASNRTHGYTSENQFTNLCDVIGATLCHYVVFLLTILSPVLKVIKEYSRWKLLSLLTLVMLLLSCVSDNSVFVSDYGCSLPVTISPLNSFGFNEFDFTSHLSYKRENFFGRSWFFKELGEIFENIEDDKKGVLLTGDPGSGKSALMSQLICSPFSNFAIHDNIIGYHVCDYSEEVTRDGSSFVRNLVDQIASNIDEYASRVLNKKQIRTHLDKRCERDPNACFFTTIIGPLRELKIKPDSLKYIVIDALDECIEKDRETSEIMDILYNKISTFPEWLKIIMSSRNWTTVTSKVPRTVQMIYLNPHDERNIEDTRCYISRYLRRKSSFVSKLWNSIPKITDELTKRADGNFLFAKTVLKNNLGADGTFNAYSLPNSLHDIYNQIFQRYFIQEDAVRFEILFEILLAAGSLHQTEIFDIFQNQGKREHVQTLFAHVSSLLHFGHDGAVSIYHQSFAEWLVNNDNRVNGFSFQKRRGHAYIADLLVERTKNASNMTFKQLSRLCMHVLNSGGPSDKHRKQLALINVTKIRNQQNGQYILHELAQRQNGSRLLEIFLPSFSSADVPDFNGKSPAYYAALNGLVDNLKLFITYGRICANCILKNVSSLHEIKAAIKFRGYEESSIMHVATYNGHTEVVDTLLKHNASFIQFNEYIPTLLHVAAERGHLDLVKLLHQHADKADIISLHHAAAKNNLHVVKYLLETAGVNDECLECKPMKSSYRRNKLFREIHDMFCETALHAAVSKRHINITRLLLQFGNSALECKHYSGKTPLMDAVERNDIEMADILLQNGANVEEKCGIEISLNFGETFGFRFFHGKRSLYTVYREKTSCACGNKAVHLCAKYGLSPMAKYLINNWNASVFDENCNGETVWKIATLSHNQDFIDNISLSLLTRLLLNLEGQPGSNRKSWKMGFKQLSTFENLLRKFSMRTKPYQSSFQCDSTFEGMSPLHIAALMGMDMLNSVYKKAHEIALSLPLNCTNKHWITPKYLAHFYDSIPALTNESPSRLKQTPHSNDEYKKTMLQYPDREAEFHMIYNYFYDSPDEWKSFLMYEMFKPLEKYGIDNCPGYYDMPTKEALEPSCDRYSTTESEKDTDDFAQSREENTGHELQHCKMVWVSILTDCEDSTELEEITFNKPKFASWIKEIQELMELEEYMLECGCPTILGLLQTYFTKFPKKTRYVNQFISERMGWKETSRDGEILKHWPMYFFHKKLKNEYHSYKYLDILNEGFKIKLSIDKNDDD